MFILSIILPNHKEPNIDSFIESIERVAPGSEIIISNDRYANGKGWAVREGLRQAKGDTIAILDSDGDIPARMLLRLIPFLSDFSIVVGTKRIAHKRISRKILTILSRAYIRIFFGLNIDTQTGIKLFKRTAIPEWESDGFIFDVEILAKSKQFKIIEVPIEAEITAKMTWRAIWRTLKESCILKYRLLFPAK